MHDGAILRSRLQGSPQRCARHCVRSVHASVRRLSSFQPPPPCNGRRIEREADILGRRLDWRNVMNSSVIDLSAGQIVRKERPSTEVMPIPEVTPMQMLAIAVQQGADMAKLEKLMELQDRWENNQARKAYVAAMSAFKANPPTIVKNKHVEFELKTGG